MKLCHVYKKPYKIFIISFIGILFLLPIAFSGAQTTQELNDKINQKNVDISKLEQEIAQYQSEIDDLGKQKDSLNKTITQLDLSRKKLTANISVTQNNIDKTNLKIQELNLNINDKEDIISNNIDAISSGIRIINEFEQSDTLVVILSENDFTTIWNEIESISDINDKIIKITTELKKVKSNLENTRTETTKAKEELINLKSTLADQKKIIDQNTAEKKKLLTQTKNSESSYQKLLKDRLAKKDAFEKELLDYESQLKYILNPSLLPNAGALSWPLDYIYVTQFFGKTEAGKRLYTNGTHNGVDFRASVGTPVKAMADGTVLGTGDTDLTCPSASFGKFVFIKYNNGLSSTYGHLSLIKTYKGQSVKRGEVVGYSGNTGYSTGPHLHVSVYASDAVKMESRPSQACVGHTYTMPIAPINGYLDPIYYLPPYKK